MESQSKEQNHAHSHGGIFGKNTELIFSLLCGFTLGVGYGLSFVKDLPGFIPLGCYVFAFFFGGFFTAKEAVVTIAKGHFEIDFLMLVAAIGAAVLGEWAEGALLLFLFSLGHALENYAMNRAKNAIASLADLSPKTAIRKREGKEEEVPVDSLFVADIVIVRPNTKIPADGVIISGEGSVNQAPITGESIPVDKFPVDDPQKDYTADKSLKSENKVFAGTINGTSAMEIKVLKKAEDSTLARLIKIVNETEAQKSPTQLFTDKLQRYYVPAILLLVAVLMFAFLVIDESFSKSFYRAMSVLVAASPCALAIATPSAVLSAVARAAKMGVLVKGGGPLEELGDITAIAFDKTGTLTEGKPKLTESIPLNSVSEEELLQIAVSVEKLSDHPLAKAIVKGGLERINSEGPSAGNLNSVTGHGVKAGYKGSTITIGNLKLFKNTPNAVTNRVLSLEKAGNTTMLVQRDDEIIGILALMDTPREQAAPTLDRLQQLGVKKMIMLTGDNQRVAETIAKDIGLTEAFGGLLPEQKVESIKRLNEKYGKVAMVGDGVNDAPAMAKSKVGIAMGAAGSDVALETADIALMSDKLEQLPFAIGLSRKSKDIIRQNLWISLGMVAVLIPLTISGLATIGPAVIAHEGSTLIVVFNALRLLAYSDKIKA